MNQFNKVITTEILPLVVEAILCSSIKRKLFALPVKSNRLGIPIFAEVSDQELEYSLMLLKDLWKKLLKKNVNTHQKQTHRNSRKNQRLKITKIPSRFKPYLVQINKLNQQQGSPIRLTTHLLAEKGHYLTKLIWNFIRILFGWTHTGPNCWCDEKIRSPTCPFLDLYHLHKI